VNIKDAKEQITYALTAYLSKDEFGRLEIPIERQRPIFLMGPPGVGKTAIIEQITQELSIGFVSYSMTHHTRQSAIGLPFITAKNYGGREYQVSEYTMSEIIASVYDMIELSGKEHGILFLDEINCVSETLAPAMLQFLQYKIFGRHRVPNGWVVVTAGNPPEYNNSVREFDSVTWDRLKRIDIEPDFVTWKEYAYRKGVHPAIMSYLSIKNDNFYIMQTTVDGKSFVTARGWVDLSDVITLYEKHNLPVSEKLIVQYLQHGKTAKDFAIYYDLFKKYRSDYQIDIIAAGKATDEIKNRAGHAKFDERLALLGLLLDSISGEMRRIGEIEEASQALVAALREIIMEVKKNEKMKKGAWCAASEAIVNYREKAESTIDAGTQSSSMSEDLIKGMLAALRILDELRAETESKRPATLKEVSALAQNCAINLSENLKTEAKKTGKHLSNMFKFCENVFLDGQEVLIFVTELTTGYHSSRFISRYGNDEYYKHNRDLLFYERQQELITQLDLLEI
jgi:hypothetical protein